MIDLPHRRRLVALLSEAAELEHGLMCQYLFAAFSMKRHVEEGVTWAQLERMRRWEASIMVVARQEMEHLGLVCNLLTAIGEAPRLERPNLPLHPHHYDLEVELKLERLTEEALRRFVLFEIPDELTAAEAEQLMGEGVNDASHYQTIGRLYDEIRSLFELGGDALFIGPPGAQLATTDVVPVAGSIRGLQLPDNLALYDVQLDRVTGLASATAIIERIKEEGEGSPSSQASEQASHFERFLEILAELREERRRDPAFDPARPASVDVELTDPRTRRASQFFDNAYATLLLLLMRFFAHSDEGTSALSGLQRAAFFPMMTAVIRPLGEILTRLPAGDGRHTAGPGFRMTRSIALLPHREAAWTVIQGELDGLAATAESLAADQGYPEDVRARLALMHENLGRIAIDFGLAMGSEVAP